MNHDYVKWARATILTLLLAAITGCSGDKTDEVMNSTVEPANPSPIVDEASEEVQQADAGFTQFKADIRSCFDELINDEDMLGMLYGMYYQDGLGGSGSSYGNWYSQNVNYNDLMRFWPVGRGMAASKAELCQNNIRNSLLGMSHLGQSGLYDPFHVSSFIGDMGLAVSNQGHLKNMYSGLGTIYATPIGKGNWDLALAPGTASSGAVGNTVGGTTVNNITQHIRTTTNTTNNVAISGITNSGNGNISISAPNSQTVAITPGGASSSAPTTNTNPNTSTSHNSTSVPRGIMRQARAILVALREKNGVTRKTHEIARSGLGKRGLLK